MEHYIPVGIPSHFIEVTKGVFDAAVKELDANYLAGATYAEYCLRHGRCVVACHDYEDNTHYWLHPTLAMAMMDM